MLQLYPSKRNTESPTPAAALYFLRTPCMTQVHNCLISDMNPPKKPSKYSTQIIAQGQITVTFQSRFGILKNDVECSRVTPGPLVPVDRDLVMLFVEWCDMTSCRLGIARNMPSHPTPPKFDAMGSVMMVMTTMMLWRRHVGATAETATRHELRVTGAMR